MIDAKIQAVLAGSEPYALLLGDAKEMLDLFPSESIDCVITSPPYWKQRRYEVEDALAGALIGDEDKPQFYVQALVDIFAKIYRVLKPAGSVWLNLGDKYRAKNLMGMPWRVVLALQDAGWILRNEVIWEKRRGTQSVRDRLRSLHEHIFHLVKRKRYYYDADSIRIPPSAPTINGQEVISPTGVSGKRYRRQILASEHLSETERSAALQALDRTVQEMREDLIVDFRMTIRGVQRIMHSASKKVSGRAKELAERGFFVLKSSAKGPLPTDIWRVVPEDRKQRDTNYAVFPVELLQIPLKATCPPDGIVLDPFVGAGSVLVAANELGKRGIGVDLSRVYIAEAARRLSEQRVVEYD